MDENEEIKVSELTEAEQVNENDYTMIIQDGTNKKSQVGKLSSVSKATVVTEEEIPANTDYTIPLAYAPGTNKLEIYVEGCRLIQEENYIEVVSEGNSTTVQFKDWDVPIGTQIEFVVRR